MPQALEAFRKARQAPFRREPRQRAAPSFHLPVPYGETASGGLAQGKFQFVHALLVPAAFGPQEVGGVARGGGAQIGHHVRDGRIHFMADARHHGDARTENRLGYGLVVEGPEVLQRSAAPDEHEHLGPAPAVFGVEGGGDAGWGVISLYGHGDDVDFTARPAFRRKAQEVAHGGPVRGGDHRDAARMAGHLPLALKAEIAFGGQFLLEGFEREVKLAFAAVLRQFHHKLVTAAWSVDREPPGADDLLAVF